AHLRARADSGMRGDVQQRLLQLVLKQAWGSRPVLAPPGDDRRDLSSGFRREEYRVRRRHVSRAQDSGKSLNSRSIGTLRPARIDARARRIASSSPASSSTSGCGSSTTSNSLVPSGNFSLVTTLPLTTFARAVRIGP